MSEGEYSDYGFPFESARHDGPGPGGARPAAGGEGLRRAIDEATYKAVQLGRAGTRRIESLILGLETGEIDPAGALGQLAARDAETVRRLALAGLLEVRRRLEGP